MNKRRVVIWGIVVSGIINLLLLIFFKKIKAIIPPPEIGNSGSVGFVHYFGYPAYIDTLVFLFIIFSPVIVIYVINKLNNKK
jgi:hypothetical protein